jgi:hypothetical protein
MALVVEVITIGGGLPGLLEASCLGIMFSAPIVSLSIFVVKGEKNFRVNTAPPGSLSSPLASFYIVDVVVMCC